MPDNEKPCPRLPATICPVTPDEDCPVRWLSGCLVVLILMALSFNGVLFCGNWLFGSPAVKKPPLVQPAEKPEPAEKPYAQFPKLSQHCETCKQCASPISETGEEQGLCEEGFRLLQEDILGAKQ